jgi:alpha-L-fucosidase
VQTAGGDGNLLFNVGPKPNGTIEDRQAERLREIGNWLDKYGESIYGTRGGPLEPKEWGVTTQKGNKAYLHILEPENKIQIKDFPYEVREARLLNDGSNVTYEKTGNMLNIIMPQNRPEAVDYIVELSCSK